MKTTRSETEIQSAILEYLAICPGVVAWRNNSRVVNMPGKGGKMRPVRFGGLAGASDILGWVDFCRYPNADGASPVPCQGSGAYHVPRFLSIEVKRPGKKPTPVQATFLEMVRAAGGLAVVATCVDDVICALARV